MNNTPMVSVIMPVYNAHKYVGTTIESVLNQTYRDFELIIIDDGATDGSGAICDTYAQKDNRIVLIHQKNGGICNARNTGLNIARGKYIAFCDHDDLYQPQYLEISVRTAETYNTSLVKFAYRSEYSHDDLVVRSLQEKVPNKVCQIENLVQNDYELLNKVIRVLWNGLYRRSIIEKKELRFDENIRAGMEDFLFNLNLLQEIHEVVFISDVLFFHYARLEQSTSEKYNEGRLNDIVKVFHREAEWLKEYRVSPQIIVQHRSKYVSLMVRTLCHSDCKLKQNERISWLRKLRNSDELSDDGVLMSAISELKTHPKIAIQDILFTLNQHSVLLYIWNIHTRRKSAKKK